MPDNLLIKIGKSRFIQLLAELLILLEDLLESGVLILRKLISADALNRLGEDSAEEVADSVPESLPAACFLKALGVILFLGLIGIGRIVGIARIARLDRRIARLHCIVANIALAVVVSICVSSFIYYKHL